MANFNVTQEFIDKINSQNCTIKISGVPAYVGQTVSTGTELDLYAMPGYKIISARASARMFTLSDDYHAYYSWRSTDTYSLSNFIIETAADGVTTLVIDSMVTNSLSNTNSSMTVNGVSVYTGMVVNPNETMVITPTSNKNVSTAYFLDDLGNQINFTINSDGSASLTYLDGVNIAPSSFRIVTVDKPAVGEDFTVTSETLSRFANYNTTLFKDSVYDLAVVGDVFSDGLRFVIKAMEGFKFGSGGNYFTDSKTDQNYPLTVNSLGTTADLKKTASMTFNNNSFNLNVISNVDPDPEPDPEKSFTVTQETLNIYTENNAVLYQGSKLAVGGDVFTKGDIFRVIANNGYQFVSNSVYFIDPLTDDNYYFSVNSNIATLVMTANMSIANNKIYVETSAIPVNVNSVNNNYYLTQAQFDEFTRQVYNIVKYDNTQEASVTPITDFLVSCRSYPFNIDASDISGLANIKIRESTLNQASILRGDILTLDFGVIEIPKIYNNALDYINTSIELFLPFSRGSTSIPVEFIGSSFSVTGKVIISNGTTTITLTDINTGFTFNIFNIEIGSEMPFFTNNYVESKTFAPSNAINNIDKAYILVTIPEYGNQKIRAFDKGNLLNVLGHVTVNDMVINNIGSSYEKDLLLNLLNQGVIIK